MINRLFIVVGILCLFVAPWARAGFIGSNVQGDALNPNTGTVYLSQPTVAVTAAVEYADYFNTGPASLLAVNVSDTAVDLSSNGTSGIAFGPASFNGIRLTFTGAPAITGVTFGGGTVAPTAITFTSTQILINLAGKVYNGTLPPGGTDLAPQVGGDTTHLNVTFGAVSVPAPASVWGGLVLLSGMGIANQLRRRSVSV